MPLRYRCTARPTRWGS